VGKAGRHEFFLFQIVGVPGNDLDEEGNPQAYAFFKLMSWLGQIRPHRRDEAWSSSL